MKKFKFMSMQWMTILMVAIVSIGFVSCDGSDNPEGEAPISPLIGIWSHTERDGSYYLIDEWNFKADGTYVYKYEEGGFFSGGQVLPPVIDQITGTWMYDESNNNLNLTVLDGTTNSSTYSWKAYIQGNSMTIVKGSSTVGPYTRK